MEYQKPTSTRWSSYDTMGQHLLPAATMMAERVQGRIGPWLDIGSGSGNVLRAAQDMGRAAIGLDTSTDQIRSAALQSSVEQGIQRLDSRWLARGRSGHPGKASRHTIDCIPRPSWDSRQSEQLPFCCWTGVGCAGRCQPTKSGVRLDDKYLLIEAKTL